MRTAEEMYQYCIDNKYGTGMNRKWGIKHFRLIENALHNDEDVIMCFIGLHNYQSTTSSDNNFAYAITNKRILMAQQKMIGQVLQSVAIDNLNDITLNSGMVFGVITVDTIKEKFNVAIAKQMALNVNEKIHEVLLSLKEQKKTSSTETTTSSADELLKFKNLLDMGVITSEEFEKKKKQLLGL